MHCTSCGAEYGEKELNCPYCGSENRKLAEELRQELLEGYDREAEAMEITVPGQALRHFTKRLVRLISVVLLISVVFAVGSGIYARVSAKLEYRTKQKNLKRMETLFQEADWEGLEEYYGKHSGLYGAEFEKYREMITAYEWLTHLKENAEALEGLEEISFSSREDRAELYRGWGELVLDSAGEVLAVCSSGMTDEVILGNEQALRMLYEEGAEILRGLGCTEEEIRLLIEEDTAEAVDVLLESLLKRYPD